jgi:hypothetical protein
MKRMSSWILVMMGAFVLGGGLAVAQGKGKKQSPEECAAECKADVKHCVTLCQKRSKLSAAECSQGCNLMSQECVKDCRQGGGEE